MKLRIIAIGRDRNDPLAQLASEYVGRISRYYPAELVELKEEPARANTPIDRVRRVEAERIEKALGSERLIVLDERGKALTSKDVAGRIERWSMEGQSVAFVVGGPGGLDRSLMKRADEKWCLSAMTLPHRLARVLIAEQLYRACTILRGEPYHK